MTIIGLIRRTDWTLWASLLVGITYASVPSLKAAIAEYQDTTARWETNEKASAIAKCRLWLSTAHNGPDSLRVFRLLPNGLFGKYACADLFIEETP